jgi:hypothetical protein
MEAFFLVVHRRQMALMSYLVRWEPNHRKEVLFYDGKFLAVRLRPRGG